MPWKTPLPRHEMQPSVPVLGAPRAPAHAEGRRHAAPCRQTGEPSIRAPDVQFSTEALMKAATWCLQTVFQSQLAGKAKLWHAGSRSGRKQWCHAMASLLQEEREGLTWRGADCSFLFS